MATDSNTSSKQEILNNANIAISAAVIKCKTLAEARQIWGGESGSADACNWAEAAYYLSQVIKDLEK